MSMTALLIALHVPAAALDLTVEQPHRGAPTTLIATGVAPGAKVVFAYGLDDPYPCLDEGAFCIRPQVNLGTAVADAHGVATLSWMFGSIGPEGPLVFQAVVHGLADSPVVRCQLRRGRPNLVVLNQ
jgi:hypothetical protein